MTESEIKPFWEIIPEIFKYPSKGEALLTVGLFSVLWLLALLPGVVGFIIAVVLTAATYKFAYSVLVHTAKGHMDPPNGAFTNVSDNVFWQQLGLWLLLGLAVVVITWILGALIGMLAAAAILVALPMATIVLAIDQSIWRSLNPTVWLDGMSRIGMPYAVMVIFLLLLIASSGSLTNFVAPALPFLLGYVIANFVSMYFLVAMFFLMGYVIYQYHEEFGWELEDATPLAERKQVDPALEQAEALIEQGDIDGAKAGLKAAAAAGGPLSEAAGRYRKLLKATKDGAALTTFAKSNLEALVELGEQDRALQLVIDCNALDSEFQFRDGSHVLTFMQMAQERGKHAETVALAKAYTKRYPGHSDTPEVLFLTAKVLAERLGRDTQAMKILGQLRKAFPDHERAPEIEQLYRLLAAR